MAMRSIQEALKIIEANSPAPKIVTVPLLDALGKKLGQDVKAPGPSPRFNNSAMDGFAVRWQDVESVPRQGRIVLPICGESRAGVPYDGEAQPGRAIRISTGAMLPAGFDTVIRVEDTEPGSDSVAVLAVRKKGQDIRQAGEEFTAGDLLLEAGTTLNAPQLALLAAIGLHEVPVYAAPAVALVVTGTELAAPGKEAALHQIHDSNSVMLAAAVRQAGGQVCHSDRAGDALDVTISALTKAMAKADIVLVTGGVSVGVHDHVKGAARVLGFSELFWKVRQKPGKPLFFARRGDCLLFGLPGNPVSGLMCFMHYVQPLLRSLQGREFSWRTVPAQVSRAITNTGSRTRFLLVALEKSEQGSLAARVFEKQGSHMLSSVARADGFLVVEPDQAIQADEWQRVFLFSWRNEHG